MPTDDVFDTTEFIQYFRDETQELLARIDADLLVLERCTGDGVADAEIVNALFRGLHTIKGSAGMLDFAAVAQLAHELESVFDLLRNERLRLSARCIDLLFEGQTLLTELIAAAVGDRLAPAGVAEFIARLAQFARTAAADAAAGAGEAPAEPQLPAQSSSGAPMPAKNQTIRVEVARLDLLLDLVGELVINRTRISDIAHSLTDDLKRGGEVSELAAAIADLAESAAVLARTTNDIRESIMRARMVSIGGVFDRFPRVVRDVAKLGGKEVTLEISGGDTDLDKTIVDEVGEPLMHLVRNCVDHGIETPAVRLAAGKPRAGRLTLNAFHAANEVVIEIEDDGGGIALDKVRARAVKQGLMSETDRPTDREIVDFIFTPGFSTADKVSDISGRGVGMEIVKKNIIGLKGSFAVDTVLGKGTKFTITLPVTLAIIAALLARVADKLYSIPLDAVIELQRTATTEVRTIQGAEVIRLRGDIVPLIRVAEFFGIDAPRDPDTVMIAIVGVKGRQVGLVVDSFAGEQEIVIKPLSDVIGPIAGISGAAILGNGSISLILDVGALVSAAHGGSGASHSHLSGVA